MPTNRRQFLQLTASAAAAATLGPLRAAESIAAAPATAAPLPVEDRAYWLATLQRVCEPVLANLAENKLKQNMPVEAPASTPRERGQYTHLEALGRTLAGLAPWLELADKPVSETASANRFAELARQSIANATDPAAPDYLNFTRGSQPLVDAAFLAHACLRAPRELWEKLDPAAQGRLLAALKQTRTMSPGQNNWLLFSAMIETFLASVKADWNEAPVEKAVAALMGWYKGDGAYGDGPDFHWDYYNSYVIHPMLLDVLEHIGKVSDQWSASLLRVKTRAQRYAAVQERLIAPDGSYPAMGRSITYRCGAFQLLAQMALRQELPDGVTPAQARGALAAVIRRTLEAPGTFDEQGWLRVGLGGHQPGLAENYISTGSLYLCTTAFLPLGLAASQPFWADAPSDWTQKKIWSGQNMPADHALPAQS